MRSATANFEELMQRVQHGREFAHASFEPIFYLVFSPSEMLDIKRQLLELEGSLTQGLGLRG